MNYILDDKRLLSEEFFFRFPRCHILKFGSKRLLWQYFMKLLCLYRKIENGSFLNKRFSYFYTFTKRLRKRVITLAKERRKSPVWIWEKLQVRDADHLCKNFTLLITSHFENTPLGTFLLKKNHLKTYLK